MSKPQPRRAIVTQSVRITPNMQRVHLSGEDLFTFPSVTAGAVSYTHLRAHET